MRGSSTTAWPSARIAAARSPGSPAPAPVQQRRQRGRRPRGGRARPARPSRTPGIGVVQRLDQHVEGLRIGEVAQDPDRRAADLDLAAPGRGGGELRGGRAAERLDRADRGLDHARVRIRQELEQRRDGDRPADPRERIACQHADLWIVVVEALHHVGAGAGPAHDRQEHLAPRAARLAQRRADLVLGVDADAAERRRGRLRGAAAGVEQPSQAAGRRLSTDHRRGRRRSRSARPDPRRPGCGPDGAPRRLPVASAWMLRWTGSSSPYRSW